MIPTRSLHRLAVACLIGLASSWAWAQQAPIPIRIGTQAQTSWLLYLAKDLQLFEKAGIAPTYVKFTIGAQAIPAMQGRSIDIATPGATPFVVGRAQGVNWVGICLDNENVGSEGFLARKGTNIRKLEDLKGKTIGVARASTSHYALITLLKQRGITKDQYKMLLMGPPEQLAAMQNGDLDAVAVWEPWIQRNLREANAELIGMEADYGLYTSTALCAAHGDFLKEKREGAVRFVSALVMAYDHVQKNGPKDAIKAIASAMNVSEELATIMYKQTPAPNARRWSDPNYRFSLVKGAEYSKNVQHMAEFLREEGLIDKQVDVNSFLDDSYAAEALRRVK